MSNIRDWRGTEVWNKVLNASGDALRVDLDNATITAGNIAVDLVAGDDSISIYSNTVKDGSGIDLMPLLDTDGHLQIDVLTAPGVSTLYEDDPHSSGDPGMFILGVRRDTAIQGAGTDGDYTALITDANGRLHVSETSAAAIAASVDSIDTKSSTIDTSIQAVEGKIDTLITHNDDVEGLLGTIDADTSAIVIDMAALEVLDTTRNSLLNTLDVSVQAVETKIDVLITQTDGIETLLTSIDTDTSSMVVDLAAMEVLDTTRNSLLTTIDGVLDNVLIDTTAIKTSVALLDDAISGSEMQVDIVAPLPAGTNAIGKLTANSGVDIGDVDVISSALPTNAATDTIQATQQTALDAIKTALETLDNIVSGSEAQVDVISSALPLGATTEAKQDNANADLSLIEGHLEKLYYDTAVAVTPSDVADIGGAPYYMLYIGIAGDIKVDMNGTGTVIKFKNLQSGQMLPIVVDRVYVADTTASSIVALK